MLVYTGFPQALHFMGVVGRNWNWRRFRFHCVFTGLHGLELNRVYTNYVYHGFPAKRLAQKITTLLHPVTSSDSEAEREEPGGKSLSPRTTAKKIPDLAARDWMSFHGFTTYWMIKKAPSCTVHYIQNIASHQKDGVGQYHARQFCQEKLTEHQKSLCHSGAILWNLRLLLPAALEVQVCQQWNAIFG